MSKKEKAVETAKVATKSKEKKPSRGSKPGERRGGRQKGTPNKLNADVKAMILGALNAVGGEKYLASQAIENPGPFMTLVGKVLPLQVTGKDGGPLEFENVTDSELDRRIKALEAAQK